MYSEPIFFRPHFHLLVTTSRLRTSDKNDFSSYFQGWRAENVLQIQRCFLPWRFRRGNVPQRRAQVRFKFNCCNLPKNKHIVTEATCETKLLPFKVHHKAIKVFEYSRTLVWYYKGYNDMQID